MASLKSSQYNFVANKVELLCHNYLMSNYAYEGSVLSTHCKRAQQRTLDAPHDLQHVTNLKQIHDQVKEYEKQRNKIFQQLDGLATLEERILHRQNKHLYPMVAKLRALIKVALTSFRYRGAVSSCVLEQYNNERKLIVKQVDEFAKIIKFADDQNNKELMINGLKQGNRFVAILNNYQLKPHASNVSYYLDNPLATEEGGIIYRRGVVEKLVKELITEKISIQKDVDIMAALAQIQNKNTKIDVTGDLEILIENFDDLNNQLNSFQVWLANHKIENETIRYDHRTYFSGSGVSDINVAQRKKQNQKIIELSKNVSKIETILEKKKRKLEQRIARFDKKMKKIQEEMVRENIRLEKLEKEKYFQEQYFETKTRETEIESIENENYLNIQKIGK